MTAVENFIVQKTVEHFNHAEVFDSKILSIRKRMREIQEKVVGMKVSNKELDYSEVKPDLIEFHKLHYDGQMMEEEMRRILASIVELYSIVKLYKLELPLQEDHIKKLDDVLNTVPARLFIVEKGKVIIPDQDVFKSLTVGLEDHIRSEVHLKHIFESEAFSKEI